MDNWQQIVAGLSTALAGYLTYLRSKKGRGAAWSWFKRLVNADPSSDDLRSSVDNMSLVVDAQGQSISWLTEQQEFLVGQLEQYKSDLASAKEQLKEMESLHKDNVKLRKRVGELEAQVAKLETELERRKKYTPKAKRSDNV